jgi:hypothetical protein
MGQQMTTSTIDVMVAEPFDCAGPVEMIENSGEAASTRTLYCQALDVHLVDHHIPKTERARPYSSKDDKNSFR